MEILSQSCFQTDGGSCNSPLRTPGHWCRGAQAHLQGTGFSQRHGACRHRLVPAGKHRNRHHPVCKLGQCNRVLARLMQLDRNRTFRPRTQESISASSDPPCRLGPVTAFRPASTTSSALCRHNQFTGVGMLRVCKDLLDRSLLHNLTFAHHQRPVTDMPDNCKVMRDQKK